MPDNDSNVPKVLQAPTSPLWYHAMMWSLGGLALGLIIAFTCVLLDHFKADSMTLVYREARAPLIQYRLEKGAWPAKFDFRVPPAELAAFGFTKAVEPALDKASLNGGWSFEQDTALGKGVPAIVFTPSSPDLATHRILLVVDSRLDDGEPTKGRFRVTKTAAAFTLKDE